MLGQSYPRRYLYHGPFEFATVRGHKTRYRIDQTDWDVLSSKSSMSFVNKVPQFTLPTHSIHLDRVVCPIFADMMAASNQEPMPPS